MTCNCKVDMNQLAVMIIGKVITTATAISANGVPAPSSIQLSKMILSDGVRLITRFYPRKTTRTLDKVRAEALFLRLRSQEILVQVNQAVKIEENGVGLFERFYAQVVILCDLVLFL